VIVETVFALGAWRARHVPDLGCWCHPRREWDGLVVHRGGFVGELDRRERAFIAGKIEAPV